MSTTSPNFNLVIATSADTVNVVAHIANNFSTLDTIIGAVHTGTGQLRTGVTISAPAISSPSITGSMTGMFSITASTGSFNTVTATGGNLTVNTFNIGTYAMPGTIGSTNNVLTVQTGNAVWLPASGSGANTSLSNLATVAINTSLGTATGGFFTLDRVIATSGALTGLTSFQATTGTFAGSVVISGTATINVVNCTGGAGTFGSVGIGTYSMPSTLGSTGQSLRVTGGALGFAQATSTTVFCMIGGTGSGAGGWAANPMSFTTVVYDPGTNITTAATFTTPTSGVYNFTLAGGIASGGNASAYKLNIGATTFQLGGFSVTGTATPLPSIQIIQTVSAGVAVTVSYTGSGAGTVNNVSFAGFKMFDW